MKPSLCLTKHQAVKAYWSAGIAPHIIDIDTRRRWSQSTLL